MGALGNRFDTGNDNEPLPIFEYRKIKDNWPPSAWQSKSLDFFDQVRQNMK
jgi:hypothetical protein